MAEKVRSWLWSSGPLAKHRYIVEQVKGCVDRLTKINDARTWDEVGEVSETIADNM